MAIIKGYDFNLTVDSEGQAGGCLRKSFLVDRNVVVILAVSSNMQNWLMTLNITGHKILKQFLHGKDVFECDAEHLSFYLRRLEERAYDYILEDLSDFSL